MNHAVLSTASTTLERLRSLHSEREACALLSASLLAHPHGASGKSPTAEEEEEMSSAWLLRDALHPQLLPGGVKDAWAALVHAARSYRPAVASFGETVIASESAVITGAMIQSEMAKSRAHQEQELAMTRGQLALACWTRTLEISLKREAELKQLLEKDMGMGEDDGSINILEEARREIQRASYAVDTSASTTGYLDVSLNGNYQQHWPMEQEPLSHACQELMKSFYSRLKELEEQTIGSTAGSNVQDILLTSKINGALENRENYFTDGSYHDQNHNQIPLLTLTGQKRKYGNPYADGYDIASLIAIETNAIRSGEIFTPDEMFGKYLDLMPIYQEEVRTMRHAFTFDQHCHRTNTSARVIAPDTIISYFDFLSILSKGITTSIRESAKLRDRRKYVRFLSTLEKYLVGFLKRTSPFLNVTKEVIQPAMEIFEKEWSEKGGVDGWECKIIEASMVHQNVPGDASEVDPSSSSVSKNSLIEIDLHKYATSSELEKSFTGEQLKSELTRLGLKCGGTLSDRAARLFMTKDTPLHQLPAKIFAKRKGMESMPSDAGPEGVLDNENPPAKPLPLLAERRVDIARAEAIVASLLVQLRPILDATQRRMERMATQTEKEREQEIEEDINGAQIDADATSHKKSKVNEEGNDSAGEDDEEDEDDTPIYNPKNVPLGWDGKPIPYWLFKLHGLNHFYPCEICGNESYRGRRNFEKHFTESRHAYGMRCLGIPNTKHFHGVTKIEDAQELWGRLRKVLEENLFDGDQEEEYEDSRGNVLNRSEYEDLARQGML